MTASSASSAASPSRAGLIVRQRLVADVGGLPIVWGIFVVAVALIATAIVAIGPDRIDRSVWEQASQLSRWWAGGVGGYLTAVYLPLYVTHGYTRRDFATALPAIAVVFAAAFAALMAVGYAIETLAYRALGWSQTLEGAHLYTTPTQYPLIVGEFFLMYLAWGVVGGLVGAAFYRSAGLGIGVLPVALGMIIVTETALGPRYFGPLAGIPDRGVLAGLEDLVGGGGSLGTSALVGVAVFVVGMGLLWAVIRHLPIRPKAG